MTNFITSPVRAAKVAEHTEMFLLTANLVKTVAHHQIKMEQSRCQLVLIEKANERTSIGRKAEKFLQRQYKLVEIADELQRRMIAQVGTGTITKEMENQFVQEVDFLSWMHLEVAKSYASFIYRNFETRVISLLRPVAA